MEQVGGAKNVLQMYHVKRYNTNSMVKSRNKCPPGVFCISGLGSTLIIITSISFLFVLYAVMRPNTFTLPQMSQMSQMSQMPQMPQMSQMPQISQTIIPIKGDSRYDMAPQPLRDWRAQPEFYSRGNINIPTQGLPESFQSVGVVNVDDKILPLYGRRTTGSSDRWNYYTRTDTYNPVPIPVRFNKRDCMDDVGCQEILSGDEVKVEVMNKPGKTNMYKYGGPKYIPGLI